MALKDDIKMEQKKWEEKKESMNKRQTTGRGEEDETRDKESHPSKG